MICEVYLNQAFMKKKCKLKLKIYQIKSTLEQDQRRVRTVFSIIFICLFSAVYKSWMKEHGGSIVNIIVGIRSGYPGFG